MTHKGLCVIKPQHNQLSGYTVFMLSICLSSSDEHIVIYVAMINFNVFEWDLFL